MRGGWNRVEVDAAEAISRYKAGMSINNIALLMNVSRRPIDRILRASGIQIRPHSETMAGRPAPNRIGRISHSQGYVLVLLDKDDPLFCMANRKGYVFEHRLVKARAIGRALLPTEVVHHIDGNRSHNDDSNLELHESHSIHMKEHMTADVARARGAKGGRRAIVAAKEKS